MAIRDTFYEEKYKERENLAKTFEDKVLKNEASEKDSALKPIFLLNEHSKIWTLVVL